MKNKNVLEKLIFMDEGSMESAINAGFIQYVQFLADIFNDIYDSCIELYYSTYTPVKYDRHEDLNGFNLYRGKQQYVNQLAINLNIEGSKLLPYAGKKDKRDKVLNSVLDGLRGAGSRKTPPGWPMNWYAYYPNEFSKFSDWKSSETTLDGILSDFANNGAKDTTEKFYDFIGNNI